MQRLRTIDGFRGFFLLFMGIVHFNGVTDVVLGKLNHHRFGWVQDAQGFVFISGLVVGLVYGKKYLRNPGISNICAPILRRVRCCAARPDASSRPVSVHKGGSSGCAPTAMATTPPPGRRRRC